MGIIEIIAIIFFSGLILGVGALPVISEVSDIRADLRESRARRARQGQRF